MTTSFVRSLAGCVGNIQWLAYRLVASGQGDLNAFCQLALQLDNTSCQSYSGKHLRLLRTRRRWSASIAMMMFVEQTMGFVERPSSRLSSVMRNLVSDIASKSSMTSRSIVAKTLATPATARRTKWILAGWLNALNAAYSDYLLSVGKEYCQPDIRAKWTLYAASACRSSGIATEVIRLEGD